MFKNREDKDSRHHERHHHHRDHSRPAQRRRRSRSRSSEFKSHTSMESESIDDSVGHIAAEPGDSFENGRYVVLREMGTGTFGKVLYAEDHKHGDYVALKVVRKIDRYIDSAKIEADILRKVFSEQRKHRVSHFVKMYSSFSYDGHYFMVFEPLGSSVYDIIKANDHTGFPLDLVRVVSRQLLSALDFLQSIKLIHTDLKLENVLFVGNEMETITSYKQGHEGARIQIPRNWKIKLIDFGGATYDNEHKSTIVNTRQYRGPEVTMELGWSYPSDIWSAACIIAEMYSGDLLFATHDDLEHLCMIERLMGYFPFRMIRASPLGTKFFDREGFARIDNLSRDNYKFVRKCKRLDEIFSLECGDVSSGIIQLMEGMLCIDPGKRYTASVALGSSFFDRGN